MDTADLRVRDGVSVTAGDAEVRRDLRNGEVRGVGLRRLWAIVRRQRGARDRSTRAALTGARAWHRGRCINARCLRGSAHHAFGGPREDALADTVVGRLSPSDERVADAGVSSECDPPVTNEPELMAFRAGRVSETRIARRRALVVDRVTSSHRDSLHRRVVVTSAIGGRQELALTIA